jgi:hypothetical protein
MILRTDEFMRRFLLHVCICPALLPESRNRAAGSALSGKTYLTAHRNIVSARP